MLAAAGGSASGAVTAGESFIAAAFDGTPPTPTVIWYDPVRRAAVAEILGHPPATARVRVWSAAGRTAVVLDEIAHTLPITAGFVVRDGCIEQAQVLVYRESRGGAVQRREWLSQFIGLGRRNDGALDGEVDGITGASLSVGAMTRMARLALFLAAASRPPESTDAAR